MIAIALRGVQQPGSQADQPPGGNRERHVGIVAAASISTISAAPRADHFHHRAQPVVRHFDHQVSNGSSVTPLRLVQITCGLPIDSS